MSNGNFFNIILRPILTEKTTNMSEFNKVAFVVHKSATKNQIKYAVEKIYNAKALSINILNIKGKVKRFRGNLGKQSDYKKAIVTLPKDIKLDITNGV